MNRQDFILNTLKPYFEDPTKVAVSEGGHSCRYLTMEGKKCALGQHIRPEAYKETMEANAASDLLDDFGYNVLTEEAQAQDLNGEQWDSIQRVHDKLGGSWGDRAMAALITTCELVCKVDLTELRSFEISKSQ